MSRFMVGALAVLVVVLVGLTLIIKRDESWSASLFEDDLNYAEYEEDFSRRAPPSTQEEDGEKGDAPVAEGASRARR